MPGSVRRCLLDVRRSPAMLALLALIVACWCAPAARADDYPVKPVTIIVPYTPGGSTEILARMVGQKLEERLGKSVIIENKPGAGTVIGSSLVAKSAPDGYTLLMATPTPMAINFTLHKQLPYDPAADFTPLVMVAGAPFVLVVHPDLPVKSVKELIAYAKANPGKLSYGSGGPGSPHHLYAELLSSMAGIKMTHVPYRGGGGPMTDLLGGQIDLNVDTITVIEPQLRAGKVTVLGVTSGQKWWSLPDITPIAATVPGYDVQTWVGLAAPKGTPAAIVQKLNDNLVAGLAGPEAKQQLNKIGLDVHTGTPEAMRAMVAEQIAKWKKVVADAGIPQQ